MRDKSIYYTSHIPQPTFQPTQNINVTFERMKNITSLMVSAFRCASISLLQVVTQSVIDFLWILSKVQ